MQGSRPTGRPKRTWTEVVQKDCQAGKLDREDAMDRSRWKKLINVAWLMTRIGECFFWYRIRGFTTMSYINLRFTYLLTGSPG